MGSIASRCLVLNGLPLTREDAESDFSDPDRHHFVRFNARGRPFARAWTEDLEKVLSVISDALKRLDDLGAYVLPRADAGSIFGAMQESFDIVVLIAHWKPHEVGYSDFSGPEALRRLRSALASPSSAASPALEELHGKLRALMARIEPAGAPASVDRWAKWLNDAVHAPDFLSVWSPTTVKEEPDVARAANRDTLDELLGGAIRPGNRVELRDGFHSAEVFARLFPDTWDGLFDGTICQSHLVGMALKERNPLRLRVQTIKPIQPVIRVEAAALAIELAENAKDYPLILTKVLDEFSRA